MIVCVCRRVSDHDIRRAASEGAVSLECLQRELGVAMQCGRCADCARRVLADARAAQGRGVVPIVPARTSERRA